jgi:molybdate transport system substrate-binding protein
VNSKVQNTFMSWCRFTLLTLIISIQLAAGCGSADHEEVVVFAAASLQDVITEIGGQYTRKHDTEVVFNFAGSNVLAQQIAASPKADVFLSANQDWMDFLEKSGAIVPESRVSFLSNRLVVIGNINNPWEVESPQDLCQLDLKYLALGNPDAVPAGRYAREWLQSEQCGNHTIWDELEPHISPAPDVRAALGMVEADPGIIGIVYQTDAAMS